MYLWFSCFVLCFMCSPPPYFLNGKLRAVKPISADRTNLPIKPLEYCFLKKSGARFLLKELEKAQFYFLFSTQNQPNLVIFLTQQKKRYNIQCGKKKFLFFSLQKGVHQLHIIYMACMKTQ